jgi:hypothetical protein
MHADACSDAAANEHAVCGTLMRSSLTYADVCMLTYADICSGKRACGLWDANEKLALARTLKDEVNSSSYTDVC